MLSIHREPICFYHLGVGGDGRAGESKKGEGEKGVGGGRGSDR